MPAEALVELCDEMGLMLMIEPFDEWEVAKCRNGYLRYFAEWAECDLVNMVHHFRNNPSVVMWSVGNEVPTQSTAEGYRTASWLQSICHREDPTRPVTCGMDQVDDVLSNGFAAIFDIPGLNYRVHRYREAYDRLPQNILLGSETASTVSSRGVYHFPVEAGPDRLHADHQSSGYDVEYCGWSNTPDDDFAAGEDLPWLIGQFVWTGFDYLGEPPPPATPTPGPTTVRCSESSTWRRCPRTATGSIAASGAGSRPRSISCCTGPGRARGRGVCRGLRCRGAEGGRTGRAYGR